MFQTYKWEWQQLSKMSKTGISQKPRHLGNFPETQVFGKFPRNPGIWEISKINHHQISKRIWKISGISQMTGYLGNFPNAWVFGKFLRIPNFLLNSDGCVFEIFYKFPKYLGMWEISQIPVYLRNITNTWISWETKQILFRSLMNRHISYRDIYLFLIPNF